MLGRPRFVPPFSAVVFLFLAAPIVVVVLSSFTRDGSASLRSDLFTLRWYNELLTQGEWFRTLGVSAGLAALAAILSTAASILAALAITRARIPFTGTFKLLMLAPLIFPHAAIAIAMLGLVNSFQVRGAFLGVLMVHVMLVIPFAFRPILNALAALDPALEEAGQTLGATPFTHFRLVTFPLMRPGVVAALLFTFLISFDEVTVTAFIVGPAFNTLPVQIFSFIQDSGSPIVAAISTVLIAITVGVIVVLDRLIGLRLFLEVERPR